MTMSCSTAARQAITILLLFLFARGQAARSCSPVMGYIRPTNFELVKGADRIVLARADSFEKKAKGRKDSSSGMFKFTVLEALKGNFSEASLTIEGDDYIRPWGEPEDFSYTKPDHGPCNPTDYRV